MITDTDLSKKLKPAFDAIVKAAAAGASSDECAALAREKLLPLVPAGEARGKLLDALPDLIRAGQKQRAANLSTAANLPRYYSADSDGSYPGDTHRELNLTPREFAEASGCRMRLAADGSLAAWVPGERPEAADDFSDITDEEFAAMEAALDDADDEDEDGTGHDAEALSELRAMILAAGAEGDVELAQWLASQADDPAAVARLTGRESADHSADGTDDEDGAYLAACGFAAVPEQAFAAWESGKHPRGQPDNAGQFAPKGGGASGGAKGEGGGKGPKESTDLKGEAPKGEGASGGKVPVESPGPMPAAKKVPARTPTKETRAARQFRDVARRRRVIKAVKNEGELSRAIQGANLPDSEPADVVQMSDPNGRPITDPAHVKEALRRREWAVKRLKQPDVSDADREQCRRILASPCAFVELKTLLTAKGNAVHMSKGAQARKARWMKKYAATFHTVALVS